MSANENAYSIAPRRTLLKRLFPSRFVPLPDDVEGMAPGAITTRITCSLDWTDRLRLLVSGRLEVMIRTQTDAPVERAVSTSACWVKEPGNEC